MVPSVQRLVLVVEVFDFFVAHYFRELGGSCGRWGGIQPFPGCQAAFAP